MEKIKLNPITLEMDENGQLYQKINFGGNIILLAINPEPQPQQTPGGTK